MKLLVLMSLAAVVVVVVVVAAWAASQGRPCPTPPDNGGCCIYCEYNHYCPANKGCYKEGQPGCSNGFCPAPPSPGPGPTPPAPPSPGPGPTPKPLQSGHFLVLGDWGHDPAVHGSLNSNALQKAIAAQMLQKYLELGDVKFIVNVGDSFYPTGIKSKSDIKWQTRWRDIYASPLLQVPWYSVYGNHDYHDDDGCACGPASGEQCAQLNSDINNLEYFYMPGPNWYKTHLELGIEVVALDMNIKSDPCAYGAANACSSTCQSNVWSRSAAAEELFKSRYAASPHKSLVVFSHYPTDYFRSTSFLAGLKDNSKHDIAYFGGHRHSVDQSSTESIAPNNNWVVGGGGGWGCDGPNQGFVFGEIKDGSISTYAVYVDSNLCNQIASEMLNASLVYV